MGRIRRGRHERSAEGDVASVTRTATTLLLHDGARDVEYKSRNVVEAIRELAGRTAGFDVTIDAMGAEYDFFFHV